MVSWARVLSVVSVVLSAHACAKAESVELGGACKQQVECKAPADTCMTLGAERLCTLACAAEAPCPSGYACAAMDVRVEGDGGAGKAGQHGYCLPQARVGSHVVTIAPASDGDGNEKKGKGKGKGKGKKKRDGGSAHADGG
jgi:hypothetical protein